MIIRAFTVISNRTYETRRSQLRSLDRADQFDVTLPFLLQQAAWLYERQLSQVRAQLRKVNKPASVGSSPTPGSTSGSAMVGGQAMTRVGSGGKEVCTPMPQSIAYLDKDNGCYHRYRIDRKRDPLPVEREALSRCIPQHVVRIKPHRAHHI